MKIREAVPSDIPEIVQVLKMSLGNHLPLSEEIWNFKHVRNPFGPSIVFIAEENKKIIGVRAFMKWKLHNGKEQKDLFTYRAVDTATHPEHRGKGIFRKLTLKAVAKATENGDDFIFNCPNSLSRPGYLKMGWLEMGKISVGITLATRSFWKLWSNKKKSKIEINANQEELESLCVHWNLELKKAGLFTPKNYEYLKWRYENNPLKDYSIYATPEFYLAVSVEARKNIRELRIVECIFSRNNPDLNQIKDVIKKWSWKFGIQLISFSPRLLHLNGLDIRGAFGPILTVRDLNLELSQKQKCFNIDNWSYSLGDVELF